jgi:hypothetical protein
MGQTKGSLVFRERIVLGQSIRQCPQLTPAALANGQQSNMWT